MEKLMENKTVRVEITAQEILAACKTESMTDTIIIHKLKTAGIPIKGTLFFRGLLSGSLKWWRDVETDSLIFEWNSKISIKN